MHTWEHVLGLMWRLLCRNHLNQSKSLREVPVFVWVSSSVVFVVLGFSAGTSAVMGLGSAHMADQVQQQWTMLL